jgi:D-aminopeptidase
MVASRPRDLGVRIGSIASGSLNSITDVAGVRVGHRTVVRGADGDPHAVRTGVTAIFPHEGEPWREPVYAATHILNGYGELIGINTIREWGILESPILLTSSMLIGGVYESAVRWIGSRDAGAGEAVMPCVTECDDSWLSDVGMFPIAEHDVAAALEDARSGRVEEGCVGGGTGMQCFDFKGGIGTASRVLSSDAGGHTVGVLAMTNHGDREHLRIDGVRVGEALDGVALPAEHTEGSCIVVVATDAPLVPHQLRRVAERAGMGLAVGGSHASNSSGEQLIAFSTANRVPRGRDTYVPTVVADGYDGGHVLSSLFRATIEATEEAVVNALFAAETTVGRSGNTLYELPVDRTLELLEAAGRLERS